MKTKGVLMGKLDFKGLCYGYLSHFVNNRIYIIFKNIYYILEEACPL